jgi:hypothetical protein
MVKIICEEYGNRRRRKIKFIAEPDMETIHKDLFSVVKSMHDALKGVRRVDAIMLPNLKRPQGSLMAPDTSKNS